MEKHRLYRGAYVEVALGEPREEDVIRHEDDYGRIEETVVMVSGGFDPLHVGHLRLFEEAKKLGTRLVVVLNCDRWLVRKKGKAFMSQDDRAELIRSMRCVDEVFILESERNDVVPAIEKFRPHIFANGGDRRNEKDIPEADICKKLGVKMIFNVGGDKIRSSSELLEKYHS
ncbi:MAG: adenylyltransferase/cytidyltransferase family protein [Parcubacteria group bacterium]|nr:adenylyltransferase/cytidyltransferase family protein [Parcubacteria group bacterium]